MRDLYEVLGIPRDAEPDAIRRAYRRLAQLYHPDRNASPEAAERFAELARAYEVLSDPNRRKLYDLYGEASLAKGFDPAWAQPGEPREAPDLADFGGFGEFFRSIFERGAEGVRPEDFFGRPAGSASQRAAGQREAPPPPRSSSNRPSSRAGWEVREERPERQSRGGERFRVNAGFREARPAPGPEPPPPEPPPAGRDVEAVAEIDIVAAVRGGEVLLDGQHGQPELPSRLRVRIPPHSADGQVIRIRGQGLAAFPGGPRGDLLLTIRILPHPLLQRTGDDLEMEVPVTLGEALLGALVTVPTPDGDIRVRIPPGCPNGQRLRIRQRGLPRLGGGRGDLFLIIRPTPPRGRSERLEALARELDALYLEDVRAELKLR